MSNKISKKRLKEIQERDKGLCVYCGDEYWHLDHVIPKSKGGSNGSDNLVMSCVRCNLRKNNLDLNSFYWKNCAELMDAEEKVIYLKKVVNSIRKKFNINNGG